MKLWSNYILAATVDEAVRALAEAGGKANPVAGGTDLLLELQQGRHSPVHTLVDVSTIPDLQRLEVRGGQLFVGAGVPVARIVEHPLMRLHAPAVVEACGLIGGPQVRNTATLGGNVAHALPAADGMIALAAMDAVAEVADANGYPPGAAAAAVPRPWQKYIDRKPRDSGGFLHADAAKRQRLGVFTHYAPSGCGAADPQYGYLAAALRRHD